MTVDMVDTQTQAMNLTPDRQGYLGDMKDRSTSELMELLERQEKILSKRQFLESLPDKGEKTKAFAVYLKHLIQERSSNFPPSTVFTDTVIGRISDLHQKPLSMGDIDKSDVVAQNELNKPSESSEENWNGSLDQSEKGIVDGSSNLVSSLEKMSLGGSKQSKQTDAEHYINSYERVIKQAEAKSKQRKQKFLPHRTLLHNDIPPSPYPHDTAHKKPEREEESAAFPPCYKFQKSQLISIEESVKLVEQQRVLNEELTTQRAARKLADQLLPKMEVYAPSRTDMRYRETVDTDQDSDDEEDDDDDEEDTDID